MESVEPCLEIVTYRPRLKQSKNVINILIVYDGVIDTLPTSQFLHFMIAYKDICKSWAEWGTHGQTIHLNGCLRSPIYPPLTLPFLDVLVDRSNLGFTTSVYRKPTFTRQYTQWDSCSSTRNKIALINILVNRAQRICSPCNLPAEIDQIMNILSENGYPEHIVKRYIHKFLNTTRDRKIGPVKCQSISGCPGKGNHHEGLKYKSNILCSTFFWLATPSNLYLSLFADVSQQGCATHLTNQQCYL